MAIIFPPQWEADTHYQKITEILMICIFATFIYSAVALRFASQQMSRSPFRKDDGCILLAIVSSPRLPLRRKPDSMLIGIGIRNPVLW